MYRKTYSCILGGFLCYKGELEMAVLCAGRGQSFSALSCLDNLLCHAGQIIILSNKGAQRCPNGARAFKAGEETG